MKTAFDRAIRQVQWRCHVNCLLENLVWALLVAGGLLALAGLGQKFFAVYAVQLWMVCALVGASAVAAAGLWALRRTDAMSAAILLDRRLGLRERFSTALALSASDDPFAQAAVIEAYEAAKKVQVHGQFPIHVGRQWMSAACSWVLAGAILLFLPTLDVLGYYKQHQQKQDQAKKLQDAKADVRKELAKVTTVVNQLGEKDWAGELAKLDQAAAESLRPEDIKREAVKKLEEIAGQLDKKNAQKIDTFKDLQDRLKGLRGSPEGLTNDLNRALAKGNMEKAAQVAKEIQRKLDEGKLDAEKQQALKNQLKDIAKQLEGLAGKDKALEDALSKEGLDKDLAKLDKEDLEKELKDKGLTQEQIDELMQKLASSQAAREALQKLAQAMAKAGDGSGENGLAQDLGELGEQLGEMEALLEDMELVEANLNELRRIACRMGGGDCDGEGDGAIGDWADGLVLGRGRGTGGPGVGMGKRDTGDPGDVAYDKVKSPAPVKEGPAIASTFIKGSQVKGESQKQFQDIVQKAKDAAAEAITENQIPKKYEGPIKDYFGKMDKK